MAQKAADRRETGYPANEDAQRIEEGLWRISVPLPFALRQANIYLIANGDDSWTLVDAGLGLPADEYALRAGLALAGVGMDRIAALILTHAHPDHVGLSDTIQQGSGAPVYVLRGEDAHLYGVWSERGGDRFAALERMYIENGLPVEIAESARAATIMTRQLLRLPKQETLRLLRDGERLTIGAHTYECIWTPGHSDFHLCLLRDDGLFIAGDHILPSITPNIGLYPDARPDPLGDYYGALARVRDLSVRLVLPGHRLPFVALAERVDELRRHHEERSAVLYGHLRARPEGADAAALSRLLFGERLRTTDDVRFALVETLAHLEHLRVGGSAERRVVNGRALYVAAE